MEEVREAKEGEMRCVSCTHGSVYVRGGYAKIICEVWNMLAAANWTCAKHSCYNSEEE